MLNKEVEIKFKISKDKFQELEEFLTKNADFISETKQTDTYFSPKEKSFILESGFIYEWLRLRQEEGKCVLTYKLAHDGENKKGRETDEYETEVSKIDQMEKILKALNFEQLIKFEKYRKSYKYEKYFEISLDTVSDLGYFVELELKGKFETVEKAEKILESISKKLNLNSANESFFGYAHLLMIKKGITFEPDLSKL